MTPDHHRDTILAFLELPPESRPLAEWRDGSAEDLGCPWDYLRDAVRAERDQQLNHFGLLVRLRADREGWRAGRLVRV